MKKLIKKNLNIKLLLALLLFNLCKIGFSGAPALNKDPIPEAPYIMIKTNHIVMGVEWEKQSLTKILPANILKQSTMTGGIHLFNSKKKQTFSPLSGSFGWLDVFENNKKKKIILFSVYGPNKTINNVMKEVYNLDSKIGSNKVTLINNKVIATTSINKKNVLNLLATGSSGCKSNEGDDVLITNYFKSTQHKKRIIWYSEKECDATLEKLEFLGDYKDFKVKKVLWTKSRENTKMKIETP